MLCCPSRALFGQHGHAFSKINPFTMFLGFALQHPKTGQTIATIIALTCVLVAGFFVLDTPVWIDW